VGLRQLVPLADATPGPSPRPIDIGLARIQPLICYEALFPGYTSRGARLSGDPAQLIVNISNDAWFGKTSGPWQHHNQARYRAIEENLPMIRATPTGISSVIDKYGRISSGNRLGQGGMGTVDAVVYVNNRKDVASLNDVHSPPPYEWIRGWGFLAMLALSCLISLLFYRRVHKK
jgi:apolipoprotein N-acyltransferase